MTGTGPSSSNAAIRIAAFGVIALGHGLLLFREVRARRAARGFEADLQTASQFFRAFDARGLDLDAEPSAWIEPTGGPSTRRPGLRGGRFRVSTPLRGDVRLMVEARPSQPEGGILDLRLDHDQARRLGERLIATAGGRQR